MTTPLEHGRILVILAVLGILGTIAGMIFHSTRFGLGILVGSGLAFANYYWLKRSLKTIFAAAAEGEKPRMLAGNYFLRYIILGAIVAAIYAGDLLPIVPVILGMAGFGFAVVVEAIIRVIYK
ncbi:MAG TPA: ATP synthase subunit I [Pyrinomonadaceae bacterium]|nr:ATP synthase subunit I [Pyrinomonadaceae bacterium]